MAKKWVVMIIILIVIVGICVWENLYISSSFDYLQDSLFKIETSLKQNPNEINTSENILLIKNLHEDWKKKTKILKTIVWHTGMKEVEINLSRILSYTEQNNFSEAMVETGALEDFCRHYADDFTITIENIL